VHALFVWAYAVMAGLLAISFVAGTIAFWKAFDVKFSREEAAEKGAKVNWKLAYEQRVTVFRLGLWLGLAAIALYYIDLNVHFTGHVWWFPWNTYSAIAIGWFLTVPLRQVWVMAVAIQTNHVLVAHGEAEEEYFNHSLWATIRRYYSRGLRRGEFADGSRMFKGRLRFLNKVSFLVKLAVGLRHWVWPVFAMMVFALVWPFTAFWLVFKHTMDARDLRESIEPWWRFDDDLPGSAEPNLERISAAADGRAEAILLRAQSTITQHFLDTLDQRDLLALGRYGARQPTIALRAGSARRLHAALLATAICQLGRPSDPRDLMVGLAVHHVVAQKIGVVPSAMFEDIAARLPDGPIPNLLRDFGARQDITLEAFGWQLVQTPLGSDFVSG
jgi:hypothetical protein